VPLTVIIGSVFLSALAGCFVDSHEMSRMVLGPTHQTIDPDVAHWIPTFASSRTGSNPEGSYCGQFVITSPSLPNR
jgi:hypothetical protein